MNRVLLIVAAFSAPSLLILDSAVKGTVLLVAAAVVTLLLRRDSAATRHLVWLIAMVALLLVPALSALLPAWRALPEWLPMHANAAISTPAEAPSARPSALVIGEVAPGNVEAPGAATQRAGASPIEPHATYLTSRHTAQPAAEWSESWLSILPVAWVAGVGAIILRLLAARWLLWSTERQATVLSADGGPILSTVQAAALQLGIGRPICVMVHSGPTIPVVWGILHYRLLLPEAARQWSPEQLQSVLLHELAHLRRRDTLTQLLTQIVCALHWFNPLVWFAAWRLGVERERACDDLVLACGVRPSAYAGHLLDIVTRLAPARWTHACGLAIARKSSLEGRLIAVLSDGLNRRRVSTALAAIALTIAAGVAVPLAMLQAAGADAISAMQEQPQAQATEGAMLEPGGSDETTVASAQDHPQPKNKQGQALFKMWQHNVRANGDIPGGLMARLGDKVNEFISNNKNDAWGGPSAQKMAPLVPRFGAAPADHDWKPADVVSLLDDIAAVSTIPLEVTMSMSTGDTLLTGAPLPKELAKAPWGDAQLNGLRLAWLLEPRAAEYRLGTPLRSRILIHNSGKNPVAFRTRYWHQSAAHKARDASGAEIKVDSTFWTTRGRLQAYRLAPGEYIELIAAGIGVGTDRNDEDWQNTRVGSWIEAQVGDTVHFTPDAVPLADWNETSPENGEPGWWRDFVFRRLGRDLPLPAAAEERRRLLDRAVHDLFGAAPTAEETAAFVADREPNALDTLLRRLAQRPALTPFSGSLQSADTTFRVLPRDPDAAKRPRTAHNPGRYTLGDHIRLMVSRRPDGERVVNEASIHFYAQDPTKPAPGKPFAIKLPDGYGTWAAAWIRGGSVLWVQDKDSIRSIDFTNPAAVKETPATRDSVPPPVVDALRAVLEAPTTPPADAPVKRKR
jgi:beta-lactamase regulating signal transducer with metallopeptidase domain